MTVSECLTVLSPSHCLLLITLTFYVFGNFSACTWLFFPSQVSFHLSDTAAATLIGSLRDAQGETESYPETTALHYPTESQRTVVFAQNQPTWSKKSFKADTNSGKISAHTNKPAPQLMHANIDPSVKSEVYLVNPFTSQLDSPEPFVLMTTLEPRLSLVRTHKEWHQKS